MTGKKAGKKKSAPGPFDALRPLKQRMEQQEREKEAAGRAPAKKSAAPAVSSSASRESHDGDDDALLLHRLFAGVEPLDRSRGSIPKEPLDRSAAAMRAVARGEREARAEAAAVHEHLRALVEGRAKFEVADDGRHVEGRRVDVPLDALRQLRRGRLPVDDRLDMHGMSVAEARAGLEAFLRSARSRGERCVLVIHGKGAHSPGGTGILRGEIAAWLSQDGSSENVAAFATAQGGDGGEGAVYVLIRR